MIVPEPVLEWLLEESNPSVRYRTLTELLGRDAAEPDCAETKARIASSPAVEAIFAAMTPDGGFRHGNRDKRYGDVFSGMRALDYLAELGMTRTDPRVARAVECYLKLQQDDGDFRRHYSCVYGHNLRMLVRLGYGGDERVERTRRLLLLSQRHDGGYLCDLKHRSRNAANPAAKKSCVDGTVSALLAFSEMPELWGSPQCSALVNYFLKRDICFRTDDMETPLPGMTETAFPFSWKGRLLPTLYSLSRMGHGNHPKTRRAWELLEKHRDEQGRYRTALAPSTPHLREVAKGKASKWVTFYAYLAYRTRATVLAAPHGA